jgi:hypothetical protein
MQLPGKSHELPSEYNEGLWENIQEFRDYGFCDAAVKKYKEQYPGLDQEMV